MTITLADYQANRARFAVTRDLLDRVLAEIQPLVIEALGAHASRHVLDLGRLPVIPIMTTRETHGGWGEAMPVWFKPYERPIPLYCLDNWALFASLYRAAFGSPASDTHFTIENLVRVMLASNVLMPFLPSTQGAGRFLRHGAWTMLLAICWLEPAARDAWLDLHQCGAQALADALRPLPDEDALDRALLQVESDGLLAMEQARLTDEHRIAAFFANMTLTRDYVRILQGVCLNVAALGSHYGTDWRAWVFQAVNVHYRLPGFGLKEIRQWLDRPS